MAPAPAALGAEVSEPRRGHGGDGRGLPRRRFVMTHRDPVQTLASIAKLTLSLRGMRYDRSIDPHEVGRDMLHFVQRHIDGIMSFTGGPEARRVVHVDYY